MPQPPISLSQSNCYQDYLVFAVDLVHEAANIFCEGFSKTTSQVRYKDVVDLVTETDTAVEQFISKRILSKYPDHIFLGEESVASGECTEELTDAPTWIVDPVDGTTNFVHRLPHTCISIAFAINRKVVVGVVFNPISDELYTAVRGNNPSLYNGSPMHVSQTSDLQQALVATGFPYQRDDKIVDHTLRNIKLVLQHCQAVRRLGSAALDMCHVARGVFDLYYEYGVHSWDIAAASLIVEQAGGIIIDMYDDEFTFDLRRVACGPPALVKQLKGILHRPE